MSIKKRLNMPKGVNGRIIDNPMAKRKEVNKDQRNTTQKTDDKRNSATLCSHLYGWFKSTM